MQGDTHFKSRGGNN